MFAEYIGQPIRARWMLHVKGVSKTTPMFGPKNILLETMDQESAAKSNLRASKEPLSGVFAVLVFDCSLPCWIDFLKM